MIALCSRYKEKNLLYFIHGVHPRYNEYKRINAKYDSIISEVEWESLQSKKVKVKR
jgi:hypothetical protein